VGGILGQHFLDHLDIGLVSNGVIDDDQSLHMYGRALWLKFLEQDCDADGRLSLRMWEAADDRDTNSVAYLAELLDRVDIPFDEAFARFVEANLTLNYLTGLGFQVERPVRSAWPAWFHFEGDAAPQVLGQVQGEMEAPIEAGDKVIVQAFVDERSAWLLQWVALEDGVVVERGSERTDGRAFIAPLTASRTWDHFRFGLAPLTQQAELTDRLEASVRMRLEAAEDVVVVPGPPRSCAQGPRPPAWALVVGLLMVATRRRDPAPP